MSKIQIKKARLLQVILKKGTIAGTVKKDGVGISRKILIYPKKKPTTVYETISDEDGNFSITIEGYGERDNLRVICVGVDGENSQVFEDVKVA